MSPIDLNDILERARGAARVGDHEAAERLLTSYLSKKSEDRDARLLLGTVLAKAEKWDSATDEFLVLVSRNPADAEALNNLAVIYRRREKFGAP